MSSVAKNETTPTPSATPTAKSHESDFPCAHDELLGTLRRALGGAATV
ncbi:MAG: hypothetical protein WBW31_17150 [Candidatus Sulfotelmatobacter sp.]